MRESYDLAGWHHLGIQVDDVDATIAELKRRGVKIVTQPRDVEALGLRIAFFADPWENLLEVIARSGVRLKRDYGRPSSGHSSDRGSVDEDLARTDNDGFAMVFTEAREYRLLQLDTNIGRSAVDIQRLINHEQAKVIIAIAEARSFSGAAAGLGVSQPAISQQVRRIEHFTGRVFFRRSSRGVELTSDGEALVVYAKAIRGLADDFRSHLQRTQSAFGLRLSVRKTGRTSVVVGSSRASCGS